MDPDLPVMQALQSGDDTALNELIARHREPLHRFAYRYLQNDAATADVVQETFVRVYFKCAKYEPRSSVKTWIYAIAANLCHDQYRRLARRRGDVSLDLPPTDDARSPVAEPIDPSLGPEAKTTQSDQFAFLQQAIDMLPHSLKAALVLFSLEGHSQKETAEILGTTPKTIELRVYHAKEKLRQILEPYLGKEVQPT